jgi:hypothetical protein
MLALAGIPVALLCGADAIGARPSDPWAALRRPLLLKPLAPGAVCPVSAVHPLDRGHLSGAGVGPIYPLPSPFSSYDRQPGWLGAKTLWAWPTLLKGHPERVLVRGVRLDRPGSLRFQVGPQWASAPHTKELHIDTSQTVGSFGQSRWGATVTMLLVRTPGCYGLQLDSQRGTSTIVIDATTP